MKLVYLWVEDYKNIHKQGFEFSLVIRIILNVTVYIEELIVWLKKGNITHHA